MTSKLCSFQLCRAGSRSFLTVRRDDSQLLQDFNTLKKSIYGYFKVELTFLCSVKLELRHLTMDKEFVPMLSKNVLFLK